MQLCLCSLVLKNVASYGGYQQHLPNRLSSSKKQHEKLDSYTEKLNVEFFRQLERSYTVYTMLARLGYDTILFIYLHATDAQCFSSRISGSCVCLLNLALICIGIYLAYVYRYSQAKSEWAIPEKEQTGRRVEDIEFPSKKNIHGLKIKNNVEFPGVIK